VPLALTLECYKCFGEEECGRDTWNTTICKKKAYECFTIINLEEDYIRKDCLTREIRDARCTERNSSLIYCSFCRGEYCRICEEDLCNASTENFSKTTIIFFVLSFQTVSVFWMS
ncbi:unnamed protein product, partial [Tenebrio molitor]